jgi:hypothetical protein
MATAKAKKGPPVKEPGKKPPPVKEPGKKPAPMKARKGR